MQPNPLLSIAIPTFQRAAFLDKCLEVNVPVLEPHGIAISISDNASSDETRHVVEKWQQRYPLIRYQIQEQNIGPDRNAEFLLRQAQTDFVWLLGDAYRITPECMNAALVILSPKAPPPQALVFNLEGRENETPKQIFTHQDELLSSIGWHMTCISTLVFSRALIQTAAFGRYQDSLFMHLGILLEHFGHHPFQLHWIPEASVEGVLLEGQDKVSWQARTFTTWLEKWPTFVFSLPHTYSLDAKRKCVMDHGHKSGLFSLKGLLIRRANGIVNWRSWLKYRRHYPLTMMYHPLLILGLTLMPRFVASTIRSAYQLFKHRN